MLHGNIMLPTDLIERYRTHTLAPKREYPILAFFVCGTAHPYRRTRTGNRLFARFSGESYDRFIAKCEL